MRKPNKKGFTIVELVIVIAVVAILAAVLIPTFVSVTKRANESKDTQLVRNLNTALAIDVGAEHKTMQSALDAAAAAGYDVAKINASATGNEILWDSKNDCFVYVKDGNIEYIPDSKTETPAQKDLWKIVKSVSSAEASTTYSSYIVKQNQKIDALTVKTGVDVGENSVDTLTYVGTGTAQDVVVRTNGGALVVNATTDCVNHYGNASVVTVESVADNSYHEFGGAKQIIVKDGRCITESSSVVTSIVAQPAEGKRVTIDVSKKNAEVVVSSEYKDSTTVIGTEPVEESATIVNALEEAKKYPANATRVPSGFVVDKTNRTLTIKDEVALMYYGYVLDSKKALSSDGGEENYKSFWYDYGRYKLGEHAITVLLDCDIDLNNAILDKGMGVFGLNFDGQNHTIKNAKISDSTNKCVGLFADLGQMSIKNLTVENITVVTHWNGEDDSAGVLAGSTAAVVENITVKDSSVSGAKYTGGVVGYGYCKIDECTVNNVTVDGQYKIGGVIGFIDASSGEGVVTNNSLSGVTITGNNIISGRADYVIGKIVGHYNCNGVCTGNTFEGTVSVTTNIGLISSGFTVKE